MNVLLYSELDQQWPRGESRPVILCQSASYLQNQTCAGQGKTTILSFALPLSYRLPALAFGVDLLEHARRVHGDVGWQRQGGWAAVVVT